MYIKVIYVLSLVDKTNHQHGSVLVVGLADTGKFWYTLAHMLKIRLQRIGRRNDPHFRVLVAEHTEGPKSNKFVEKVGTVNPKTKDIQLNEERIKYWLSVGAQASGRVHNMLVKAGIIKADTINVLPQKSPVVKEEETKDEAPAKEESEGEKAEDTETKEKSKEDEPKDEKAEEPKEEVKEEVEKEEASKEEPEAKEEK